MNWYCLHTRPGRENDVLRSLNQQLCLETYFPRLRQMRRIRRVRRVVVEPLFPRYVFCRFDPVFQYRAVRYSQHVINVVNFGEEPAIVPEPLLQELKTWAGETMDLISAPPMLQSGDNVEIAEGPFQGLRAVILHETAACDRVAVLLSIFAMEARLTLHRSLLIKVV